LTDVPTKSSLSDPQRQLIELMQAVNFGTIEHLCVRGGEPVLSPAPTVIQKLKIGAENGPRQELNQDDFLLKQQHIELFETLSHVGDGEIRSIQIKYGLAFAVEIVLASPPGRLS